MIKHSFTAKSAAKLSRLLEREGVAFAAFKKAIRKKDIIVDGIRIKEDLSIKSGSNITIFLQQSIDIAYQCDDFLILNKPKGMISAKDDGEGLSLEEMAQAQFPSARPCHRLDANTRGLIIFALNDMAYQSILASIKSRAIKKYYHCIAKGIPQKNSGILRHYHIKEAKYAIVKVVERPIEGAKEMLTGYRVLESRGGLSLLEIELLTGRTHQIRAHLSYIGHPILGDDKYGDRAFNKELGVCVQQLCAVRIELSFENGHYLHSYDGLKIEIPSGLKLL